MPTPPRDDQPGRPRSKDNRPSSGKSQGGGFLSAKADAHGKPARPRPRKSEQAGGGKTVGKPRSPKPAAGKVPAARDQASQGSAGHLGEQPAGDARPKAEYLEGHWSVRAALTHGRRPVYVVYLDPKNTSRDARHLKALAKDKGITIKKRTREQLDQLANGTSHGGIMAACGPLETVSLDALLKTPDTGPIVLLDGVEDPFNFGQSVRTLMSQGCRGVIVRQRNWTQVPEAAGVLARASAGAMDALPIATVEHPTDAVTWAKAQGLPVWAAEAATDETPLPAVDDMDWTQPALVLVGGEKRGLPKATLAEADQLFTIPTVPGFDAALGTVPATAILAAESARQRRAAGK